MTADLTRREDAELAAERLRILAQPTRLMILALLRGGERSVGQIETALQLKQPGLSQQLGALRQAEMVATRREAKSIYYRLADSQAELLVSVLENKAIAQPLGNSPARPGPVAADRQSAMFATVHTAPRERFT